MRRVRQRVGRVVAKTGEQPAEVRGVHLRGDGEIGERVEFNVARFDDAERALQGVLGAGRNGEDGGGGVA